MDADRRLSAGDVVLRARDITRRWGGVLAVDRVSLELARGEIHALIGTNGAGKSTLVNVLSGEVAASSGSVELEGRDVTRWPQPRRARAGLGRSYQRTTVFAPFSVFENCRLAAQARYQQPWRWWSPASRCEACASAARESASRAGLDGVLDREAGLLSHGERRQLEIAMCLAMDPRVLLLDEPLAGMGAEESTRMLELLAGLRGGHAILLVEHDMDAVFRVADRITVLVDGSAIASGAPRDVRDNPRVQTAYLGGRAVSAPPRLLEARGVHAWYGSSHVLHGVDLAVARGETVGLLGRNGMGKTTLIRVLLGFVRQRAGTVSLAGEDVSHAMPHEIARRGIAYVPEGRAIFPNLTVRENLLMAARGPREGRAAWTLERVLVSFPRLTQRLARWGAQLSGGEQQMLAIGRALMTQPDLVVLDEATEGLAPLVVDEVWRMVGEIRAAGVAALIVDRDYRRVGENSSRLIVLRKGEVALQGESRHLLAGGELVALLGL